MELTQLRYFKAVAESGKIVTAANALFVTPPTISTSISQLEKELGTTLFDREDHRLTLNRQGRLFLVHVDQILNIFRRAYTELAESVYEAEHSVTVAVSSSNIWVDLITDFALVHPDISLSTITLTSQDIRSGIFRNRYSLLLANEDDLPPDEASTFLFEDRPAVMVYPTHPFANRTSIRPDELSGERLIWPRMNQYIFKRTQRMLDDYSVDVQHISTYSYLVCQSLVAQGSCIALTTMHAAHKGSKLIFVPIDAPETLWRIWLYQYDHQALTPEEEVFRSFVLERYKTE